MRSPCVAVFGDTTRRTLVCRQETDLERPETREAFRHPDLLDWIAEHRHHLVSLALTVLRGFCAAGSPKTVKPLGSFEAWAKLVAGAIVWAGGPDVTAAIADASQPNSDPEKTAMRTVLQLWGKLDPDRLGITLRSAVEQLYPPRRPHEPPPPPDGWEPLREALEQLDSRRRPADPPDVLRLGNTFRKYRKRTIGGLRLVTDLDRKGIQLWSVEVLSGAPSEEEPSAGSAGSAGSFSKLHVETVSED